MYSRTIITVFGQKAPNLENSKKLEIAVDKLRLDVIAMTIVSYSVLDTVKSNLVFGGEPEFKGLVIQEFLLTYIYNF